MSTQPVPTWPHRKVSKQYQLTSQSSLTNQNSQTSHRLQELLQARVRKQAAISKWIHHAWVGHLTRIKNKMISINCVRRLLIEQLVSKKKMRYKADGYNLDLSYVTHFPRILVDRHHKILGMADKTKVALNNYTNFNVSFMHLLG